MMAGIFDLVTLVAGLVLLGSSLFTNTIATSGAGGFLIGIAITSLGRETQ